MRGAPSPRSQAVRGGVILLLCLVVIGLLLAKSFGRFDTVVPVVARLDSAGGALEVGAEVKLDGVVVGKVTSIEGTDEGVDLALALDPERADRVPSNVTVRVLPISIFGAAYVELLRPKKEKGQVRADAVLAQDTSSTTIELGDLLEDTQDLVDALGPAELATALETFASTLDGKGEQLGEMIDTANSAVARIDPLMPIFREDLRLATTVARTVSQMTPNLFTALDGAMAAGQMLIEREEEFREVLSGLVEASGEIDSVVTRNQAALALGIPYLRRVVSALYLARGDIPRTFAAVIALADGATPALSFGRYLRVDALVRLRDEREYTRQDCPSYGGLRGKGC
ncbi:MCE family protein [Nocardioides dubius]|uniref:MCE family protein n=1 Tax=Nocardioides dubius TaxID=317019 RepID=A0ABP4E7J5_9ACTN